MPVCIVCHKAPSRKALRKAGYTGNWTTQEEMERQHAIRNKWYRDFVRAHAPHNPKWAKRWMRSLGPERIYTKSNGSSPMSNIKGEAN